MHLGPPPSFVDVARPHFEPTLLMCAQSFSFSGDISKISPSASNVCDDRRKNVGRHFTSRAVPFGDVRPTLPIYNDPSNDGRECDETTHRLVEHMDTSAFSSTEYRLDPAA